MKVEILDVSLNTISKVKKFTNIANDFDCEIDVLQGRYIVSGRSIIGIFSLNLSSFIIISF